MIGFSVFGLGWCGLPVWYRVWSACIGLCPMLVLGLLVLPVWYPVSRFVWLVRLRVYLYQFNINNPVKKTPQDQNQVILDRYPLNKTTP